MVRPGSRAADRRRYQATADASLRKGTAPAFDAIRTFTYYEVGCVAGYRRTDIDCSRGPKKDRLVEDRGRGFGRSDVLVLFRHSLHLHAVSLVREDSEEQ